MTMPSLIRTFTASNSIGQNRIVQVTTNGQVSQAAGNTASMIGVCIQPGGVAAGQLCDVILDGIAEVVAGNNFNAGALVTADGQGRAVAASAAAGTNIRVLGVALQNSSALGDIIPVLLAPGSFQG